MGDQTRAYLHSVAHFYDALTVENMATGLKLERDSTVVTWRMDIFMLRIVVAFPCFHYLAFFRVGSVQARFDRGKFEATWVGKHCTLPLVEKWRPTDIAGDFARDVMISLFRRGREAMESIAVILQKPNACLWEDDRPLKRGAMQPLALSAVAVLRIQWVARESETYRTAPAGRLVFCLEELFAVWTTRWGPVVRRL